MSSSSGSRGAVGRFARGASGWGALLLLGLLVWVLCLGLGDAHRAWRALLVNFIYFTPLAAGMVVWPAVITSARGGNWLIEPVRRSALAAVSFAPFCLVAFFVLWLGRRGWAGWIGEEHLHNAAWLNSRFLFTRDAIALVVFWWIAGRFVKAARSGAPKRWAGWLVFVYCAVFSLLGFDLVMALDPHWYSTLFGAYFFITGLYIAIAAWTFAVLLERPAAAVEKRKDLGKLVVAFSLLSTYMMFCQLLPIWYENLPEEVRFVIPRLRTAPWRWVSVALLVSVYLGPLLLLLSNRLKGSVWYLRGVTLALLVGMWFERWWLVTPTLGGRLAIGLAEVSMTAVFLAALVLGMRGRLVYIPPNPPSKGDLGAGSSGHE